MTNPFAAEVEEALAAFAQDERYAVRMAGAVWNRVDLAIIRTGRRAGMIARDPEVEAAYREHIRRIVDDAPPLSPERKARLAVLLTPDKTNDPERKPRRARAGDEQLRGEAVDGGVTDDERLDAIMASAPPLSAETKAILSVLLTLDKANDPEPKPRAVSCPAWKPTPSAQATPPASRSPAS